MDLWHKGLTFCKTKSIITASGGSIMKTGRPKIENAKRKSVTVRLPDEIYRKLVDYAAEHNMTKTEVALQSLEKFLSKQK